jgi:hypothetical protein
MTFVGFGKISDGRQTWCRTARRPTGPFRWARWTGILNASSAARRNGPAARRTVQPLVWSRWTWRRTTLSNFLSILHLFLPDFEFLFSMTCIFIWCCFFLLVFFRLFLD